VGSSRSPVPRRRKREWPFLQSGRGRSRCGGQGGGSPCKRRLLEVRPFYRASRACRRQNTTPRTPRRWPWSAGDRSATPLRRSSPRTDGAVWRRARAARDIVPPHLPGRAGYTFSVGRMPGPRRGRGPVPTGVEEFSFIGWKATAKASCRRGLFRYSINIRRGGVIFAKFLEGPPGCRGGS